MTTSRPLLALLAAALPVQDRRTLLGQLVECWRTTTGSADAALASADPVGRMRVALSRGGVVEHFTTGPDATDAATWEDLCRRAGRPVDWLPTDGPREFIHDGRVLARVWLSAPQAEESPAAELHAVSLGLLRQAELCVAGSGFDERLESARLAALAEFAAGAGHEINNPVATIAGRAQQLLVQAADPEQRRSLAAIVGQAHRIRDMIGDVMLFARPPQPHRERLALRPWLAACAARLAHAVRDQAEIRIDVAGEPELLADPVQLEVLFGALVRNAADTRTEALVVTIHAATDRDVDSPSLLIQVRDNGPGIAAELVPHLFDPYFSGRPAGRGLGFGLCKAWRIAEQHGGKLRLATTRPGETVFELVLPLGRD